MHAYIHTHARARERIHIYNYLPHHDPSPRPSHSTKLFKSTGRSLPVSPAINGNTRPSLDIIIVLANHVDSSRHQFRRPFPATAPPNLPNCLPNPDLFAGTGAGTASFCGMGCNPIPGPRVSLVLLSEAPSPRRNSLNPTDGTSLPSMFCL